ncbi:cytochrome C oxidase subunit I [Pontibacter sp. HJ8]
MSAATISNSPARWVVLPHYAFAAVSFVVLCLLLVFSTDAFGGHYFHPKLLTLTHVAALGWATMIIFGSLYQLLPVVLEVRLYSEKLGAAAFLLLAVGTILLAISFWNFWIGTLLHLAACLLFISFLLFSYNVVQTARQAPKWGIEADFIVTSTVWLLATGLMGLLMALNFQFAFLPQDHVHYLQLHAHLGMVGWFLLLIIGVGSKLIPMFLLAHPENTKSLNAAYFLINAGLVLFAADHLFLHSGFAALYAALVVGGIASFLYFLYQARCLGKRHDLDLGMKQSFVALALLLLPIVLVFLVTLQLDIPQRLLSALYLVYGLSVFFGFVSALILGQTFKTLPFIVWMHSYEDHVGRYKTPLPKDLYSVALLRWQNITYLVGLLALLAGVLLAMPIVILAGAMLLTLAAGLYAGNVFKVLLHKVKDLKPFGYEKVTEKVN